MGMDNDNLQQQLIKELLIEGFDGLERFDQQLVALEEGTADDSTLNTIFRVIHTIKGTAGCIGLQKIASVAHVGENLLSLLRDGDLSTSEALIDVLLEYSDALKEMLRTLESTGEQGEKDYTPLLDRLHHLQEPGAAPSSGTNEHAPAAKDQPQPAAETDEASWGIFADEGDAPGAKPQPADQKSADGEAWGIFAEEGSQPTQAPAVKATAKHSHSSNSAAGGEPKQPAAATGHGSVAETAIRVDVGQLDRLMNLVGELVLARNQIVQVTSNARSMDATLGQASQRLNIITTELQEAVMKTRMQPIENVWGKFPRIVRDVAHDLGKQVNLVMEGKSTELDRTIIEAIRDPLTHIIRNAIDHGIETPEVRRKAGKSETGTLILRAFHEGGLVIIEIMDDGGGINVARVKQKAVEKALITAEAAARMADRDAFDLIFLPGFSTAEKITNVSGRGVGMDVVKSNVERIGGSVDISSELGNGTTLRIKIPLTLAIIPALVVTAGGERFAIPQVSLLELVRLEGDNARRGIESLYGSPVYRLRGKLLPVAYLHRDLGLEPPAGADPDVVNIVVVQADGRQFGLVVDEVNDTEEIVVKPLSKQLRGVPCYAGATIMGDGRVALILDVLGFAHHTRIISETLDHTTAVDKETTRDAGARQTLLLFRDGEGDRMAIPLSLVARLEEFPRERIERCADHQVVQYRERIMPLVRLSELLPGWPASAHAAEQDPLRVVVHADGERCVGLVVDQIEDIVEECFTVQEEDARPGVLGSAVIHKHVTTLLDLNALFGHKAASSGATS
ncbi:MAG: chemotaxis protein CheW [Phycisphaerae bacterium]|nr:chemotaxis protein CheW [Phycisphaerae bacterium]